MRDHITETLFSLFASRDHAEAIAGDLIEQRETKGTVWFWLQVARTMLALWGRAIMDAPLSVTLLAASGGVLFIGPAFAGTAAVGLFPYMLSSLAGWITLAFFWWGGAAWVGGSLIGTAPRQGMAACAMLAIISELLLIGAGIGFSPDLFSAGSLFYTTGLVVPAALLAGGAIASKRTIARAIPALEPPR